jgi:tetratricopeptide (TPR) repeat protein
LAGAYFNRGRARLTSSYLNDAIADYTKAIRLDPKNGEWYFCRATAHQLNGDEYRASVDFDSAERFGFVKGDQSATTVEPKSGEGEAKEVLNEDGRRQDSPVPVSPSPASDVYILSEKDRSIVAATKLLLRKIIRLSSIRPNEMEVVAKVLGIFERLPRVSDELNAVINLTGPRHQYGEHEIYHYWIVEVEGAEIRVSSNGHFYRPSSGGDSFTCMQWRAVPGCETFYGDYLDGLRIVDDAQPYETEVARLPISEPGYHLSVELEGENVDVSEDEEEEDEDLNSVPDESNIQPCDESEQMLAAEADEVRGQREGTFSADNPKKCDLCGRDLTVRKYYLDARHLGKVLWSNMCSQCFLGVGEGIGWGKGQLFSRQPDGMWLQVAGFRDADDE